MSHPNSPRPKRPPLAISPHSRIRRIFVALAHVRIGHLDPFSYGLISDSPARPGVHTRRRKASSAVNRVGTWVARRRYVFEGVVQLDMGITEKPADGRTRWARPL